MLEEENSKLAKDLADVFRENEKINEDFHNLYEEKKLKEQTLVTALKEKEKEIAELTKK